MRFTQVPNSHRKKAFGAIPNTLFTLTLPGNVLRSDSRSWESQNRCLKTFCNYHKIGMFPGSSTVERSAVNCTAEKHKPLFWRRLATKLSPLIVPQLCPAAVDETSLTPCLQSMEGKTLNAFAGAAYTENQRNFRSSIVPKLSRDFRPAVAAGEHDCWQMSPT